MKPPGLRQFSRSVRAAIRRHRDPVLVVLGLGAIVLLAFVLTLLRDPEERQFTSTGPLDIKLLGVRPDVDDDLYNPEGEKIGELPSYSRWTANWSPDSMHRDFVFSLPAGREDLLFIPFHRLVESDSGRSLQPPSGYKRRRGSRERFILSSRFNRTVRKTWLPILHLSYDDPVEYVDITIRFFHGPRGKARFRFEGPFTPRETVSANTGPHELTPLPNPFPGQRASRFQLKSPVFFDPDQEAVGLAYDKAGNRHLARTASGSASSSTGVNFEYHVDGILLRDLAVITFGEQPKEQAFRNIRVRYPDRPIPSHAPYLDRMAEKLGLSHLTGKELAQYNFEDPVRAVRAVDVVRGSHVWRMLGALSKWGKNWHKKLPQETRERVRRALHRWSGSWDPSVRVEVVRLAKWAGWVEFLHVAVDLLGNPDASIRGEAANSIRGMANRGELPETQVAGIKKRLLSRDDPASNLSLISALGACVSPATTEALHELARADRGRPWLWMPAVRILYARDELEPQPALSEELRLRLEIVREPVAGDSELEPEAAEMLPDLLTAELPHLHSPAYRRVFQLYVKQESPRTATRRFIRLLRNVDNARDVGWAIEDVIKYMNRWHDADIGKLGTDVTTQCDDYYERDWQKTANEAIECYENNYKQQQKKPQMNADKRR